MSDSPVFNAIDSSSSSTGMPSIPLGSYRHYKGPMYSLLGFARHSETQEWMVLYVPLYGDGGYWVRPYSMFVEKVELDGESVERFKYAG